MGVTFTCEFKPGENECVFTNTQTGDDFDWTLTNVRLIYIICIVIKCNLSTYIRRSLNYHKLRQHGATFVYRVLSPMLLIYYCSSIFTASGKVFFIIYLILVIIVLKLNKTSAMMRIKTKLKLIYYIKFRWFINQFKIHFLRLVINIKVPRQALHRQVNQ